MEDCTVKGLNGSGVHIGGEGEATLTNLRVEDNASGIIVVDANVSVSRSVISGQTLWGVQAQTALGIPTRAVITDSVLSHNGGGILGMSTVPGVPVRIVAARNLVINGINGIVGTAGGCLDANCVQVVATDNVVQDMTESGIFVGNGATVVASRNTVTNSAIGLNEPFGGTFISMQDNVSELNTKNTNGTITPGTLR